MKYPDLYSLEAFVQIYRKGNITRAAEALNVSKAALTKRLKLLEEERGELLFRRTTRKLVPTPEGDSLYQKALRLFEATTEFDSVDKKSGELEGIVRITCTASMAQSCLTKILIEFQRRNPHISIDLVVTDSYLDMIENNIDLAVRIGKLPSSSLHGKRLAENKTVICATPAYLKKHGKPKTVNDLKSHSIGLIPVHYDLKFLKEGTKLKTAVGQQKIRTSDTNAILQYALAHESIIVRSYWHVRELLLRKTLVHVLEQSPLENNGDIWLLSSTGRLQTKRVRVLFDYLAKELPPVLSEP